jgi:hypothetical protein
MMNNKYKGLPSVVLLNSEGDILKAFKTEQGFMIMDEYKEIIATLNQDELFDFTRGKLTLTNSKDEFFDYTTFSGDMKPNLKMLDEFIGIDTNGLTY